MNYKDKFIDYLRNDPEAKNEIEIVLSCFPKIDFLKRYIYERIEQGDAEGFLQVYTLLLEIFKKQNQKQSNTGEIDETI